MVSRVRKKFFPFISCLVENDFTGREFNIDK